MSVFPTEPEIDRDRFGRPLVVPPGGGNPVPYTRCTTYVDCLDDKFKLQQWQQRMVALGLSQRNDLLLSMQSLAPSLLTPDAGKDAKTRGDAICERALEAAAASAKATTGTALHTLTESIDRGVELGHVAPDTQRDLDAYRRATAELTAVHIERFCVHDELKIGGTPDRVVEFNGRRYIADLKTGSVDFAALKISMQLAVYAHSKLYDVRTHERSDLAGVDRQRAIVIHLPAGTGQARLLWVDIASGWDAVQVATQVRDWRRRRGLLTVIDDTAQHEQQSSVQPPREVSERRDVALSAVRNAVASAASVDELAALWRTHRHIWDDELTVLAAARKALLLGQAVNV